MVLSVGRGTNRYASALERESEHINANQLALFSIIWPSAFVIYGIFSEVVRLRGLRATVIQYQGQLFLYLHKELIIGR